MWQSTVGRLSSLSSLREDPAALSLQLYRLIEDVRHSFSFPLPAGLVSASAFSSFLSSFLSILRVHYAHLSSSSSSHYLQAEQANLTSSTGLQFLQLLIDRGAVAGEGEAQDVRAVALLLLDVVEGEKTRQQKGGDDEQSGDAAAGQQSWLQVDALRALSRLLDRRHPALLPLQPRLLTLLLPTLEQAVSVTSPPSSEPPSPALSSLSSSSASSSSDATLSEEQRLSIVCLTALAPAMDAAALSSLLPRLLLAIDAQLRGQRASTSSAASSGLLFSLLSAFHASLSALLQLSGKAGHSSALPFDLPSCLSSLHRLLTRGVPLTLETGHVNTSVEAAVTRAAVSRKGKAAVGASSPAVPHSFSPFASPSLFSSLPSASSATRPHAQPAASPQPSSSVSFSPAPASKQVSSDEQIRLCALSVLSLLATYHLKAFHQHWAAFIPPDPSSSLSPRPFSGHHLVSVLLFDPSSSVRAAAASLLSLLLVASPLSKLVTVGTGAAAGGLLLRYAEMIRGLHAGVLEALRREKHGSTLTAVVKLAGVLAANTPYEQLSSASASSSRLPPTVTAASALLVPLLSHLVAELLPSALSSAARAPTRPPSRLAVNGVPPSSPAISQSSSLSASSPSHHTSQELASALFTTLACILDHPLPELSQHLSTLESASSPSSCPALIPQLLSAASSRLPSDPPADAFLPLALLARRFPQLLSPHWRWHSEPSLSSLLVSSLFNEADAAARMGAVRVLEEWTRTDASELREEGGEDAEEGAGAGVREPAAGSQLFALPGAADLYGRHLPQLFRDAALTASSTSSSSASTFRSRVMVLLSYVPYSAWTSLSPSQQQQLLLCVKQAAEDSAASVRTASCRSISLFAVYAARSASESQSSAADSHSAFVEDALRLLVKLLGNSEPAVVVRARAAWAIANLCESSTPQAALPSSSSSAAAVSPVVFSQLPQSVFQLLLSCVLESSEGNDKIVSNAIRAVGNIARWLPLDGSENAAALWRRLLSVSVSVLQRSGSVKSRWNAAYAMANLMRNAALLSFPALLSCTADGLLPLLLHTLTQHLSPYATVPPSSSSSPPSNFKVSINAAVALSCPASRAAFGSFFPSALSCLLLCLQRCEAMELKDWKEVRYREALRAQLIAALLRQLSMLRQRGDGVEEEEAEVVSTVSSESAVIARLLLKERMRLEGERNRARMSSVTKRATAAVSSAAQPTAAAALDVNAPSGSSSGGAMPTLELLDTVAERVAAVLPDAESRARFLLAADGGAEQQQS